MNCFKINLIAAMSMNGVIGIKGSIPWRCKEDMNFFKQKTMGGLLIMGRKTYESLPASGLPGREIFVITRTPEDYLDKVSESVTFFPNLDDAIAKAKRNAVGRTIWIAGGGEIYRDVLENHRDKLDDIYLSVIDVSPDTVGATMMPTEHLPLHEDWDMVVYDEIQSPHRLRYIKHWSKRF